MALTTALLLSGACSTAERAVPVEAFPAESAVAPADPAPTAAETTATETTETAASTEQPAPTLEDLARDFLGDSPGGVIAIVRHDGETEIVAVGDADASGTPLTPDTPMRVGSISKPFVAAMILQLVESGDIDLDARLDTYLGAPPLGGDVTIRQLLEHRSGLPNYTDQRAFFAEVLDNLTARLGPTDVLTWVVDVPAQPPGSAFSYSNTNYILLGTVLESADLTSLEESLQSRIVEPAGLTTTWFDLGDDPVGPGGDRVAAGWSTFGYTGDPDEPYTAVASGAWAAGALVSTAPDLLRFLDALRDGSIVDESSLAMMTDTGGDRYGLGMTDAGLGLSGEGYGHDGGIPGFFSSMRIARDSDDAIIILTNNDALAPGALLIKILATF